jgi:AraC family transcriptional regulator
MSNPPQLTVDFTQEQTILTVVPHPPLLTSKRLGWRGINVQSHCQPAWQSPEANYLQHVIVIVNASKGAIQAERTIEDQRQKEQLIDGSCVIIPANAKHRGSWDREVQFTLLNLEPIHLKQIAHETVNHDHVELIPQFARLDPVISGIGSNLRGELETDGVGGRLYAESATTFLAAHLLRYYCTRPHPLKDYTGGLPRYKLREAIAYIHHHLGKEISLEAISSHLNMSQYYFCHLFKQSMGVSPYQYVLRQRIEKAKQLLKQQTLAITDVALECGFANQTHFTKHFRKLAGITPKAYREL